MFKLTNQLMSSLAIPATLQPVKTASVVQQLFTPPTPGGAGRGGVAGSSQTGIRDSKSSELINSLSAVIDIDKMFADFNQSENKDNQHQQVSPETIFFAYRGSCVTHKIADSNNAVEVFYSLA